MDHVELDIKEMLELGKKTANTSKVINSSVDVDTIATGNQCVPARSISKPLFTLQTKSFSHLSHPEPQITTRCHQKAVSIPPTLLTATRKYILKLRSSFDVVATVTDDSEEWTGDDDEPVSPGADSEDPLAEA